VPRLKTHRCAWVDNSATCCESELRRVLRLGLLRAEDKEPEEQEAHRRGDHHGDHLRQVTTNERREVSVGHEAMGYKPEQGVAHPDIEQPLGGELAHLPGVVAGLFSEGPQSVPQVTVGIRENQRYDVLDDE
jgi:hypothetical protein